MIKTHISSQAVFAHLHQLVKTKQKLMTCRPSHVVKNGVINWHRSHY